MSFILTIKLLNILQKSGKNEAPITRMKGNLVSHPHPQFVIISLYSAVAASNSVNERNAILS